MPLTKEELLKPRIKCVIDYPGNIFGVDKILQFTDKADKEFSFSEEWIFIKDDVAWGKTFFDQYPLLFKKLEWWEDIKLEDMPEFVKCVKSPDGIISVGQVLKCSWNNHGGKSEDMGWIFPYTNCYEPATEEEYTAYINQKQPPNKP